MPMNNNKNMCKLINSCFDRILQQQQQHVLLCLLTAKCYLQGHIYPRYTPSVIKWLACLPPVR
jgi:hypothetical protein